MTVPTDGNSTTSIWVDGNSNAGTENTGGTATLNLNEQLLASNNYYTPPDNSVVRVPGAYSYSVIPGTIGNNLVGKVKAATQLLLKTQ